MSLYKFSPREGQHFPTTTVESAFKQSSALSNSHLFHERESLFHFSSTFVKHLPIIYPSTHQLLSQTILVYSFWLFPELDDETSDLPLPLSFLKLDSAFSNLRTSPPFLNLRMIYDSPGQINCIHSLLVF